MALMIQDNTGVPPGVAVHFDGQTAGAYLQAQLAALSAAANTAAGGAFLGPLLDGPGPSYTVKVQHGGATATSGATVTINIDETSFDKGVPKVDGDKEFVESVIFELVNATNSANFAALLADLDGSRVDLWGYGGRKADIEAEASWTLAQILQQAQGGPLKRAPSAWGAAHVAQVTAPPPCADLAAFQQRFRALPHDPMAGPNDPKSLPSWAFYAFNAGWEIAATSRALRNGPSIACTVTRQFSGGRKSLDFKALLTTALGPQSGQVSKTDSRAASYYDILMSILSGPLDLGTVVEWRGSGGSAPWNFTPAMTGCRPDVPDWRDKLTKALNKAVWK